jgi:hypothetical protein
VTEPRHLDRSVPPGPGGFVHELRVLGAALVRRQPWMEERSLGVGELASEARLPLLWGSAIGALGVAVTSDLVPVWALAIMVAPFVNAHVSGVRHRWAAALVAGTVGGLVGGLVALALPDASWGDLVGMVAGTLAAVAPYALVTQVGRPRHARAGRPAGSAPG